jgi:LacI family repressor for deo operon, udp, cdd, tsx, nupC, and nupG
MTESAKLRSAHGRRPKMADIARLAGVSVSTVSRALAGSPLVTEETRRKIKQMVGDTGYVINHVASGLRLQRSRQILVMLPTIANPFFAEIVLGVEEEAQRRGFGVLVGNTSDTPEREEALARHLLTGAVDGLVLLTGRMPALLGGIASIEDKVIAVSERIPGAGLATVSIDHEAAAQEAVGHLLALGHKRIAHIAGPAGNILTAQRLKGFRAALAHAGIEADEGLIAFGDYSFDSGETAMRELLAGEPRPTAVFCSNDEMAIGAVKAARAHGLHVPQDLAVVGFDDIPFAAAFDPPLTTIRQPRRAIGRAAASLLLDQLKHKTSRRHGTRIAHELVVRESSGTPTRRKGAD